ncbi:conserved hypothetical protein [Ricinus communis]|uniref:PAS domain-containing protein n=1 Tax=Ricinus communis TaxID=3988 RepID=B9TFQ5_RICCO|nr:conserved hypothetical protein [Ricinus communis]
MAVERRTSERRTASTLRRQAEEQLKHRAASIDLPTETDQMRLLHELQVHQIELELQNEELTQAYLEAQALRDKYWDLYDYAPVGYFTLSFLGDILEMNLCAAGMLGKERGALIGHRLGDFIHPDSLHAFSQFLVEASESQADVCANNLILRRNQNEPIYVETRGRAFDQEHNADKKIRVIMMDVSALKFATDELQHAFQKFFKYWRP